MSWQCSPVVVQVGGALEERMKIVGARRISAIRRSRSSRRLRDIEHVTTRPVTVLPRGENLTDLVKTELKPLSAADEREPVEVLLPVDPVARR